MHPIFISCPKIDLSTQPKSYELSTTFGSISFCKLFENAFRFTEHSFDCSHLHWSKTISMPNRPSLTKMDRKIRSPNNLLYRWYVPHTYSETFLCAIDTAAKSLVCRTLPFCFEWLRWECRCFLWPSVVAALSANFMLGSWEKKCRRYSAKLQPQQHTWVFINFNTLPAKNRLLLVTKYKNRETPCIVCRWREF